MYATIRNYTGGDLAGNLRSRGDEVAAVMKGVPGLRAYYLIRSGTDAISVTISDDEAGGQQSNEAAARWLRENMPDAASTPPEISAGEVVVSL